ncbi:class I SAM-dependent methyltransferase [Acidiferrimicrobium sp. IK]|uniref:class I SAM-dependent methyltransferase n=1 Tax=Acidiferrimicrobium sp. IK TaxID=2871700 RepID=UPI0021CB4D03|nr:class I SAM-dependent methyltransferase [Acidiferrimicrobium sp. IK]MCU4186928.1 class I SAM-dependent methyltransferase [Acidiferrimicrobium sp. IK]
MLTVRYDRLGVQPGDRLMDMGAGGGRHAFEAMRRGAVVIAVDADSGEVKNAAGMMQAMVSEDRATRASGGRGAATVGNALSLPFADGTFDRIIAAEVLEHIPDDRGAIAELARVLRPGGTIAVTVPRWLPELVTWAISDDYHMVPGGHVRIYRRSVLTRRLEAAGLSPYGGHHAHALHSPYWWLKAAVGVDNAEHPLVRAYHRMLVWDITAHTPVTRLPEKVLNPVLGKSTVIYLRKPA